MKRIFHYILLILIIGGIYAVVSCSLKFPDEAVIGAEIGDDFSSSTLSGNPSSNSGTSNYGSSSSVNGSGDDSSNSSGGNLSSGASAGQSSSSISGNISSSSATAISSSASIISSSAGILSSENLVDSRDGKTYKTVVIGAKVWMAENLNYDVPNAGLGSKCYGEGGALKIGLPSGTQEDYRYKEQEWQAGCAKYGRLYDWMTVMAGATSSNRNPSTVKGICPDGWHVPSDAEWVELVEYAGEFICASPDISTCYNGYKAGTKLKAKNSWSSYDYYGDGSSVEPGNGTDDFGFAALPGGYCFNCYSADVLNQNDGTAYYRGTGKYSNGRYTFEEGEYGYWWTSTEYYNQYENDRSSAYRRLMSFGYDSVKREYQKKQGHLSSLRCVKN